MALTATAESDSKRTLIIGVIIALHVGGFYVMESGLAHKISELVAPVETKIIEEQKPPEELPPPPPPPDMPTNPPPFIPPPEVTVQVQVQTNTIQAVTNEQPPAVVPPIMTPPAPQAPEVVEQPTFARTPPNLESFYPASAKREEREGSAIVSYTVQADGSIVDIKVTESSGSADLDEGAVNYVKTWRMKPGKRNGVATSMPQRKKVTFKMLKK